MAVSMEPLFVELEFTGYAEYLFNFFLSVDSCNPRQKQCKLELLRMLMDELTEEITMHNSQIPVNMNLLSADSAALLSHLMYRKFRFEQTEVIDGLHLEVTRPDQSDSPTYFSGIAYSRWPNSADTNYLLIAPQPILGLSDINWDQVLTNFSPLPQASKQAEMPLPTGPSQQMKAISSIFLGYTAQNPDITSLTFGYGPVDSLKRLGFFFNIGYYTSSKICYNI